MSSTSSDKALEERRDHLALLVVRISAWTFYILTLMLLFVLSDTFPATLFAAHLVLQSTAIVLLPYAITHLQPPTPLSASVRQENIDWHRNFLLATQGLLVVGSSAISIFKWSNGARHLTSWHSTFGALSGMGVVAQVAVGMAVTWEKGRMVGGEAKGKGLYKYHR